MQSTERHSVVAHERLHYLHCYCKRVSVYMCTLSSVPFMRSKQDINKMSHSVCVFVLGGAARGAAGGASLCVRDRECRHWKESGDEVTAKDLPEHEAQTCVGGP